MGDVQSELIPLTEEEIADMQHTLPKLIGDLEEMKTVHAGRRTEMKAERKDLQTRINNIAEQLRSQGR